MVAFRVLSVSYLLCDRWWLVSVLRRRFMVRVRMIRSGGVVVTIMVGRLFVFVGGVLRILIIIVGGMRWRVGWTLLCRLRCRRWYGWLWRGKL